MGLLICSLNRSFIRRRRCVGWNQTEEARVGSKPTSRKRNRKQKAQASFSKAREELQLMGVIETTPEGALRAERVDPTSQGEQRFPGLDREAIRNGQGWGTNEHIKRKVIEKAAEVMFEKRMGFKTVEVDGRKVEIEIELPPDRAAEAQAAKTLLLADKMQYERDHPEEAGKAKGGVNVSAVAVAGALDYVALHRAALEGADHDEVEKKIEATTQRSEVHDAAGAGDQGVSIGSQDI